MALEGRPHSSSTGFSAIGTYSASSISSTNYGTGGVTNSSTTMNLPMRIQYPVGADIHVARPLVLVMSGGGFDNTFVSTGMTDPFSGLPITDYKDMTYWADMVTAGGVLMAPYYRTHQDTPWNAADGPSDTGKKKAVRAAFADQRKAFSAALSYAFRVNANFLIDPRRVFVVGWSAGGVSTCRLAIDCASQIRGAVSFTGGFGLAVSFASPASSSDHTADIRSFIVETDITAGAAPIQFFGTGDDSIIGGSYNADLRARLIAVGSPHPTPQWKDNGDGNANHDGPHEWGNWTYNGDSVSTMEGLRRWFNDLMAGLASQRDSVVSFT